MEPRQWHTTTSSDVCGGGEADLVLFFGSPSDLSVDFARKLQNSYPNAAVVGCSAWGHFLGDQVHTEGCGVTALDLGSGCAVAEPVSLAPEDRKTASQIAKSLCANGQPRGILILWNELHGNAEQFLLELRQELSPGCLIFGGLASDDLSFESIAVYAGGEEVAGVAVGLFGDKLALSSSCQSGFAPHGRTYTVTRSAGETVHEIDGLPALDVLCAHLGPESENLPRSGMHFPIQLLTESGEIGLLRSLTEIDRTNGTFTCAGMIPEGPVRLLTFTEPEDLFEGAGKAAAEAVQNGRPSVALVVSCTGRRSLFGPMSEIELDYVSAALGNGVPCAGFYAGGEIATLASTQKSELHNQTIAVTGLSLADSQRT